jgi:glycosyltransferase involved in cell wall biosynthesis
MEAKSARHILVYEPQVDGHHVGWLRFITEDLLGANFSLTLALDTRDSAMKRVHEQMADLLPRVKIISARDEKNKISLARVAECLRESGASLAFLANFNDVASTLLRRAAFGFLPDKNLRGRFGGIYFRPLFLGAKWSPNQQIKKTGFRRLLHQNCLNPLLMIDPFLCETAQKTFPDAPIFLLADPIPENFFADREISRRQFNLPENKIVFLFYGGGYKRKGLHLVAEAMRELPPETNAFLLCAGVQPKNEKLARDLEMLRAQGRAEIVNRYVSAEEEKQLFAACDVVLLPYIRHLDGSGVLSRAAGANRPVIASDEYLIGHVVRKYEMGNLFESENVRELKSAMLRAANASPEQFSKWQNGARAYAQNCSRDAFRSALVRAVENAVANSIAK